MQNNINDSLAEKINSLGSDTIMGISSKFDQDNGKENLEKLNEAVEEARDKETQENSKEVNNVAIGSNADLANMIYARPRHLKPLKKENNIGRNDLCPCGSGKKYKNCCLASGRYETYSRG